ncbi:MAG TPA: PAS domain-containing protein, partial [Methylophilaceae bacterium]|nr:PAS domain-containing protein [Methylophilaceae bacterium]
MKPDPHNLGERRFLELIDTASHPTWITDSTGYCTYLNEAWYRITGQQPGEGEGFGWLNALHPDDRAEVEADFCESSRMEAFYCIEYRLKVASGGYRWHMDMATPRFDDGGNFLGYVGNVIDIHDRRLTE